MPRPTRMLMMAPLALIALSGCLKGSDDVIKAEARIAPLAMGYYDYCSGTDPKAADACAQAFVYLDPAAKFYTVIKGEEATTATIAKLDDKRYLVRASGPVGAALLVATMQGDTMTVRQPDCDRIKGSLESYLTQHKELHAEDDLCAVETFDQAKAYIALIDAKAPDAYDPDKQVTLTLKRKVS